MPIYEYQCAACEKTFEEWQKISDPPVKKCPDCGSKKVSRLISSTSFQLKGSGWYATDYGKSHQKPVEPTRKGDKAPKKDSGAGGTGGGSGSGGSGGSSGGGGEQKAAAE